MTGAPADQPPPRPARHPTPGFRAARYCSASALGRELGWRQSRVSKLERGALQIVVGEAALWNTPSTVDTLVNQLDRLISFAELPSLEFGVVPHPSAMPIAPLACFSVYDDNFVFGGDADR